MTNERAKEILKSGESWIAWDNKQDCPEWDKSREDGTIGLDGNFTVTELKALLLLRKYDLEKTGNTCVDEGCLHEGKSHAHTPDKKPNLSFEAKPWLNR